MKRVVVIFFLAHLFLSTLGAVDDFQYWSQFSKGLYKKDGFNLRFYAEGRFDQDIQRALGYFFGPTFTYRVTPVLSFGGAAKMIHFKSGDRFAKIRRFEGDVYLNFKLQPKLLLQNRNRYEYFSREGRADTRRIRSRFRFTIPRSKPGTLTRFFFANEFFFDGDDLDYTENRLIPFGVNFKLGKSASLNVFYLIQRIRSSSTDNHALGTTLTF